MVYDVIIIGAGQAGLTVGYFLKKTGKSFLIIDSAERVGDSWRNRYESLELFSPRALSILPGMKLEGGQDDYPTKDEIADYLEKYAKRFDIPVQVRTHAVELKKENDKFIISLSNGEMYAKNVIVATGAHHRPFIPPISKNLSKDIFQIHSSVYKNPTLLPDGQILVVGAGNSGAQIAYELSRTRNVLLSSGHKSIFVPKRILNKSLFWWLNHTRILNLILSVPTTTMLGKYFSSRQNKLIIGTELKNSINKRQVIVKPRLIEAKEKIVTFSDRSQTSIDSVIWATGFQQNFDWIKISNVFKEGKPIHERGVSTVSGLYFLGLPGLHSIGSGLFSGIQKDAEYEVCRILTNKKDGRNI